MKKVIVYDYVKEKGCNSSKRIMIGRGFLINYGIDFTECNLGIGHYSTAIVEMEDGKIKNVPIQNIRFIKEPIQLQRGQPERL